MVSGQNLAIPFAMFIMLFTNAVDVAGVIYICKQAAKGCSDTLDKMMYIKPIRAGCRNS
jgi:hypothetical protein